MKNEEILKIIKDLITYAGFSFDRITGEYDETLDLTHFKVGTPEARLLIGADGESLAALNHIVRRLVEKNGHEDLPQFIVDINDYQAEKIRNLKLKADVMAERAISFKASSELPPMPAYERLIIHTYLQKKGNIVTESIGIGKDRRIVIKYTQQNDEAL